MKAPAVPAHVSFATGSPLQCRLHSSPRPTCDLCPWMPGLAYGQAMTGKTGEAVPSWPAVSQAIGPTLSHVSTQSLVKREPLASTA